MAMQKNDSEVEFERFCEQRGWRFRLLDSEYPNIKTPDYLVHTSKNNRFYVEIKEISNKRITDNIAKRSKIFTLPPKRLFGTIENDIKKALDKIEEFSRSKFYEPLPFVFVINNVKQAFIDTDLNLYRGIFDEDKFRDSELLSAFGFLKSEAYGHSDRYLDLRYNEKARYLLQIIPR